MIELELIGWNKGLRTVSLITAICEYAGLALPEAKVLVEELLDGRTITIGFSGQSKMEAFRRIALQLGAKCK
jgi:hypothetical protein